MRRSLVALAAIAGAAAPALAQTFDGRVAFRADHAPSTVPTIPNGSVYVPDSFSPLPVTMNFAVMLGAFDAVGFTNRGLFSWFGDITVTGNATLGNTPGTRPPFTFSPVGNGTVAPGGDSITRIDAVRNPIFTVVWPDGEVPPEPNVPQGRNQYFSMFRFTVTLTDLVLSEIEINVNGVLTAIADFHLLSGDPGDDATYVASSFVTVPVSGSFRIFIPAPGAGALLCGGCLLALRRRRPTPPPPSPRIG